MKKMSRRDALRIGGILAAGTAIGACAKATPEVIKETAEEVEKVVKETVEVEKEVTRVVEKAVEAEEPTGPTNALGVTLPANALPLDEQYRLVPVGKPGEQTGGARGHIMESLYNRAYETGWDSEPLTMIDQNYNIVGRACESWEQSEDGLYWDFNLRKELVFSDGKPVTAQDWVWTLRHSFGNGYDFGWLYRDILNTSEVLEGELPPEELGVEAVDDYTFRIRSEQPVPYMPALGVWMSVAPPQAYEKYGDNWSLEPEHFITAGPWMLKELERGARFTWELNEKYTGVNRPYYTECRGRTLPEGLPAYMAGDIQTYSMDIDTPAGEVNIVNSNPILQNESHPQPSNVTWYIGFNTIEGKFPPLDNRDVRLALNKVIDKEKLIGEVSRGFAYPAWGILPKGFPNERGDDLKELDPNVFDVEAAQHLLAEAGYPDGEGFPVFELWIRSPEPYMVTLCEAIQARWKERLGINVELYPADHQSFTAETFAERNVPIYFVGYSTDFYDPANYLGVFRGGGRHPHDDDTYDEMYAEKNPIQDPEERFDELAKVEERLVEECGYMFLIQPFSTQLWPCNLDGWMLEPNEDGFQFQTRPVIGSYVGTYWSDSDCRKGLSPS